MTNPAYSTVEPGSLTASRPPFLPHTDNEQMTTDVNPAYAVTKPHPPSLSVCHAYEEIDIY